MNNIIHIIHSPTCQPFSSHVQKVNKEIFGHCDLPGDKN